MSGPNPPFAHQSASRCFSEQDQKNFAEFSGDWNPIHMDAIAARRTLSGRPVVHGVHQLLWALDWVATKLPAASSLTHVTAAFEQFVFVGEQASLELRRLDANGFVVEVRTRGVRAAIASCKLGPLASPTDVAATTPLTLPRTAIARNFASMASLAECFTFAASEEAARGLFPHITALWGTARVLALGCCTAVVGMECPGLYSIFTKLTVRAHELRGGPPMLAYKVTRIDPRFRTVQIQVEADGLSGSLGAVARMPPVEQPSFANIAKQVVAGEFAGMHALIVGGSRGLGEVAAKVIAAGHGKVTITYRDGRDDALRIQQDIISQGRDCNVLCFDALGPAEQIDFAQMQTTHLCYFATPRIGRPRSSPYEPDSLREFIAFYADGFYRLCARAVEVLPDGLTALYPSSEFVSSVPPDMVEYAMAKAAGEILSQQMSQQMPGLRILSMRLPKLLTDQTASFISQDIASPLDTVLQLIRSLRDFQPARQ